MRAGKLPAVRIAGQWRFDPVEMAGRRRHEGKSEKTIASKWLTPVPARIVTVVVRNNFGTFEGEDWLPNNPKRRLNNDLWI